MIHFPDHFLFFYFFFSFLKYVNMIRISNTGISFFRFCQKNEKLDWPKCGRTGISLRESALFDEVFP